MNALKHLAASPFCLTMSDNDFSISLPDPVSSLPSLAGLSDLMSTGSHEDVELPSDVEDDLPVLSDPEEVFGFDEEENPLPSEEESLQLEELSPDPCGVPSPQVAEYLSSRQDVAEFYSPPRVLPVARQRGLCGCLSLDLLSGWDFRQECQRKLSIELLRKLDVQFLVLSPPCTIFSELQRLWNIKKMTAEQYQSRWDEGMRYLGHAMDCAQEQHRRGRHFAFEHPARASSWKTVVVRRILALPGVGVAQFDQCMLGLKSKVYQLPMRKRTKIMTNSVALERWLGLVKCDGRHTHQTIQGCEGGVRRSVWAQCYPPGLVKLLVDAAVAATG